MNNQLSTLTDLEAVQIEGGNFLAFALAAYAGLLDKIEKNPQDYTWTMDWYYQ